MNRLVINVLGGLEIQLVGADSPLALSTRKSKALLAYLALSPGLTRSREHLATALWDRSAEEQARASLRQTLSSLRRVLPSSGSAIVNTDAYAVWLDAQSIQVDAHQFERLAAERSPESLEQAVAVYRGDLLDGFSLREESFENWTASERRRLRELALQAFSDLLSHYARNERLEPGIQIAERLLSMDPLQEWAHCALMRLYSRSGRREAALRQYQECTRILDRELGIAPAEQSQRLAAASHLQLCLRSANSSPCCARASVRSSMVRTRKQRSSAWIPSWRQWSMPSGASEVRSATSEATA